MAYYWLSFCDAKQPEGEQFLGGCLIDAEGVDDAIKKAWRRGCNPSGDPTRLEIACLQINVAHEPNLGKLKLNHLYHKRELVKLGEFRTLQDAIRDGDIK